jgi:hypothetical protein
MADFYFKVYLDVIVSVPEDIEDYDNCSHAYDKLEQALNLMGETEGISLEDMEIM